MADTTTTFSAAAETDPTASPSEIHTKLTHLLASATQQYALKNYSTAAEFFSEAAETQDAINGEMSPENADVLYQYGRCLYHVGVSKSDVLGGKVAGQEEPKRKKRKIAKLEEGEASGSGTLANVKEEADAGEGSAKAEAEVKVDEKAPADRPFFQITGDENFTDSEDEEDEDGAGEEEEEDDDFAIAYEVLDMARVLLQHKIASLQEPAEPSHAAEIRSLRERLADTHDLQAEIKLENEAFADAVSDARAALALKEELYPKESGMRAEACYKLAIALDFAALPVASEPENGETANKEEAQVDESLRKEAASYMSQAISSCQLRMEKEKVELATLPAQEQGVAKRSLADIQSLVAEMKNRLVDLQNPVPAASLPGGDGFGGGEEMLKGLLGEMMGVGKGQQKKMMDEATKGANDLSGMVRKKKAKAEEGVDAAGEGKGKRKAEDGDVEMAVKKAKAENANF